MCVRCGTGRIAWCTDPYCHGESIEPVSPGDPPVVADRGVLARHEVTVKHTMPLSLAVAPTFSGNHPVVISALLRMRGKMEEELGYLPPDSEVLVVIELRAVKP